VVTSPLCSAAIRSVMTQYVLGTSCHDTAVALGACWEADNDKAA
jgi:hypothetical protein